ncbi:MAG: DUF938 domain-containing protein [Pseudomonadales bacterium]|nr:DUF938 domain-containing protein [Pseudomonadales bacterium]
MHDSELPFSQSCENNKGPILQVLQKHLIPSTDASRQDLRLLEIAGGTGQHAAYFADQFPFLHWQSSDIPANKDRLNLRLDAARLSNLPPAITLDVLQPTWNVGVFDYVFTANSLHIMPIEAVHAFFAALPGVLKNGGKLFVYGPFKYGGNFSTPSNARFDIWLKEQNPVSGIRDFETVCSLASAGGLQLLEDNAMPANNQLLVWQKQA